MLIQDKGFEKQGSRELEQWEFKSVCLHCKGGLDRIPALRLTSCGILVDCVYAQSTQLDKQATNAF